MAGEVTVTIKSSAKHDAHWLVFKGGPGEVFAQIVEAFKFDEGVAGLSLAELANLASSKLQGLGNVAMTLGAVPLGQETAAANGAPPWSEPAPASAPATPAAPASDPWANAQSQQSPTMPLQGGAESLGEPRGNPLVDAIHAAASLEDIQRLWLNNKEEFNKPEVQEAVKARRAALGA